MGAVADGEVGCGRGRAFLRQAPPVRHPRRRAEAAPRAVAGGEAAAAREGDAKAALSDLLPHIEKLPTEDWLVHLDGYKKKFPLTYKKQGGLRMQQVIDAAYRGEVKVILLNTDPTELFHVTRGERIAQLVLQRVEEVEWVEVESLDGDDRGGSFGHSGRH